MLCSAKGRPVLYSFLIAFFLLAFVSCGGGGGGNSGGGNGGGGGTTTTVPPAPSGLAAVAGDQQVALTWNASSGATGYHVKRGTVSGGPYTQVGAPTGTVYGDTGLTDSTTYYYVVTATNSAGESGNSNEASATPIAPVTSVHVTVDVLANRHTISPYVYGVNFPSNTTYVTDSGATFVRWGGNASTRYNWLNFDTNAAADWYFQNRAMGSAPLYADSTQFVTNIAGTGAAPIMTIGMLPWVAKDGNPSSYSFSVAKYGAQCQTNPYYADDGDGIAFAGGCPGTVPATPTYITGNFPTDAHVPLADTTGSGSTGTVYRDAWVQALATKYGAQPHFYDMDNEMDIWGGTHRDVHPAAVTYNEIRDTYIKEARLMPTWDPAAVRFGPVSCCWWFYWNSQLGGSDKTAHASIDFLPWWFNEVAFEDKRDGVRSLDVFDFHAYPGGNTNGTTPAQNQALALRLPRDFWDPAYVSEDGSINQPWATQTQPLKTIAFRIPRLRALVNSVFQSGYTSRFPLLTTDPVPLSLTEWNVAAAGESDFSTALADADVFGILGRERMFAASRWMAADPATAAYQALKLYRNYDGAHHTFSPISVSATNDGDPSLFSSYAAIDAAGTTLTVMVINKSPSATVTAAMNLNHFTPASVSIYLLSQASPNQIVAANPGGVQTTYTVGPYTATLFVFTGTTSPAPAVEWDLNPDTIMVPANGSVTLSPKIVSGTGAVTLNSQQSDSGITVALTQPSVTATQTGTVTVNALATPGFYHYSVTGTDNTGTQQTQGGWIVVGNSAANLTKTGDGQTGSSLTLTTTLNVASSGATPQGASILFTTSRGGTLSTSSSSVSPPTLCNSTSTSCIATTDSSGNATVTLTLPSGTGPVTVTAEGPWPLGHPVVTFTETSN
jgi:Glycoside hydrolase family 44